MVVSGEELAFGQETVTLLFAGVQNFPFLQPCLFIGFCMGSRLGWLVIEL